MPTSPFQRAQQEGLTEPEGSSGGGKREGKSRPTTSRRNKRQKTKEKYSKAREDAQLQGVIPTTSEGAVRDERSRSDDPLRGLPEMVRQALRESWATPGAAKPAVIAALLRPFFGDVMVLDVDGKLVSVPASPKLLNDLAKTLLAMDLHQQERDNPTKGGATGQMTLNVQVVNVDRAEPEPVEVLPQGDCGAADVVSVEVPIADGQ